MSLFEGFAELPEAQAVAVQTALTQVAKQVETAGALPTPEGGQNAKEAAALKLAYDALDLLINAPGPVDWAVKEVVIPQLPAFFKWVSEQLHNLGIFQHAS